jgi:hypothetical protein
VCTKKLVLCARSKFLLDLMETVESASGRHNLFCPDFEASAVRQVLELLHNGQVFLQGWML